MDSVSEDQSIVNSEPHLILLYQSSHKQEIKLSSFIDAGVAHDFKSIHGATIGNLIGLIFKSWDAAVVGVEKPQSPDQLRLIHLGRQLNDKKLLLGDLKLDISDIIHVSVRPLEGLGNNSGKKETVVVSEGCSCCVIA